ncbi:hypothetical protein [Parahaliea aestuarii]|uniref:Bacteriocin n=1 Tax=Parahaliea aestuarii TaxID=1852021 RepID=A0A5C8ZR28_9GAMM|nr:hypothetical protein [Parahaliea aestuarii]TXS90918.1 hypothetical protein FVW59_11910 [Parahaliea aestuarii]
MDFDFMVQQPKASEVQRSLESICAGKVQKKLSTNHEKEFDMKSSKSTLENGLIPLSENEVENVSGGYNLAMINTGATMIGSSIGMAALGFATLGPLGALVAGGLAFSGGVMVGTGFTSGGGSNTTNKYSNSH